MIHHNINKIINWKKFVNKKKEKLFKGIFNNTNCNYQITYINIVKFFITSSLFTCTNIVQKTISYTLKFKYNIIDRCIMILNVTNMSS